MSSLVEALKLRSEILVKTRKFFADRQVLEVETPLLGKGTITDPNLHSLKTRIHLSGDNKNVQDFYLQTSPEFAMKKLLSKGGGSIFQIAKAFRDEEYGRLHRPEFTLLEWYRINFNHHDLMNEMDEYLNLILSASKAERLSYKDLFLRYLKIDPHLSTIGELKNCAEQNNLKISSELANNQDRDLFLNILLTHFIEPLLGHDHPTFVYDYPISQAALAHIRHDDVPVAERFEVYINGIELANGFHELTDAKEQRQRFLNDLEKRKKLHLPQVAIDEDFLTALEHGLPNCSGVALGLDRLIMLKADAKSLNEIFL
jgi:elongation factor P--(R)-beta-lysine ligase